MDGRALYNRQVARAARRPPTDAPLSHSLYAGPLIEIGAFRVHPDHPRFNDSGPIAQCLFVFPRRSVRITHDGASPVVADVNTVMFYNRSQTYRRDPVSADGDKCEWFALPEPLVAEAVAAYDPPVYDRPGRPFRFVWGPCTPEVYLTQRQLTETLNRAPAKDSLHIEETVLAIFDRLVREVYRHQREPVTAAPRAAAARAELAEAARDLLGRRYRELLTLPELARSLHTSPYHLSRVFRAHTGTTIHRYVNELRLREALERISDRNVDLIDVAIDLGFASHSHFSERFRRSFGEPPSAVRERLLGPAGKRARIRQRALRSS